MRPQCTLGLLPSLLLACTGGSGDGQTGADANPVDLDASDGSVSTGCSNALTSINGEFLLTLATPLAPNDPFLFAATTETNNSDVLKAVLLSLQPLCTQAAQCTIGNHVGSPISLQPTNLSDSCEFTATITSGFIPGDANPISGTDIVADLNLTGTIESADFYCGLAGGTMTVNGAPVSANGSTFGAKSMPTGTMGASLPSQRPSCDLP